MASDLCHPAEIKLLSVICSSMFQIQEHFESIRASGGEGEASTSEYPSSSSSSAAMAANPDDDSCSSSTSDKMTKSRICLKESRGT